MQRQRRRIPVARACKAEDPRRHRWRQMRRALHPVASAILGPGQQRHIEAAAEQFGRAGPGRVDQRGRLLQRAKRQQLVDAHLQQRARATGIGRGRHLGQKQCQEQLAQRGQGVIGMGDQAFGNLARVARAPEVARQARDAGRDQPHRIRVRPVQRRGRHRLGQGAALGRDRRLVDPGGDARRRRDRGGHRLRQPVDRRQGAALRVLRRKRPARHKPAQHQKDGSRDRASPHSAPRVSSPRSAAG